MGLVSEAETITPTAPITSGSDLTTIVTTTESEESAAAHSRLKDLEAKSALAKKSLPGPAPAPSWTKAGKAPAHTATLTKPGPAPVPGRDGATLQGPDVCRFCNAPGHRVDQCPTAVYVAE